jgi:hypothetical protein
MKVSDPLQKPMVYLDTTELLILADGRVLVHNLTPAFAQILQNLNAEDELMNQRAAAEPGQLTPYESRSSRREETHLSGSKNQSLLTSTATKFTIPTDANDGTTVSHDPRTL